eukprot:gene755-398_t
MNRDTPPPSVSSAPERTPTISAGNQPIPQNFMGQRVFQLTSFPQGVGFYIPQPQPAPQDAIDGGEMPKRIALQQQQDLQPPLQQYRDPVTGLGMVAAARPLQSPGAPQRQPDEALNLSLSGSPLSNYIMLNSASTLSPTVGSDGAMNWFDANATGPVPSGFAVSPFTSSSTLLSTSPSGLGIPPAPQQTALFRRLQLHEHYHQHQQAGTTRHAGPNHNHYCPLMPPHLASHPPQQQPAVPHSNTNLFVRHLPAWMDDAGLERLFELFGHVDSATVMRDIHTAQSLGRGFVRFRDADAALKAKEGLNGRTLEDRDRPGCATALSVQWANAKHDKSVCGVQRQRIRKLFVRNIPAAVSRDMLRQLFGRYGKLSDVSLHDDTAAAESSSPACGGGVGNRKIAFVTFAADGMAAEAAKGVHNTRPFEACGDVALMVKLAEDVPSAGKNRTPQLASSISTLQHSASHGSADTPRASSGTLTRHGSLMGSRNNSGVLLQSTPPMLAEEGAPPALQPAVLSLPSAGDSLSQSALFPQMAMPPLSGLQQAVAITTGETSQAGGPYPVGNGFFPPGSSIVSSQFPSSSSSVPSSGVVSSTHILPMPSQAAGPGGGVGTPAVQSIGIDTIPGIVGGTPPNLLPPQTHIFLTCGSNTFHPAGNTGGSGPLPAVSSGSEPPGHWSETPTNTFRRRSPTSTLTEPSLVSPVDGSGGPPVVPYNHRQYMQQLVSFSIFTSESNGCPGETSPASTGLHPSSEDIGSTAELQRHKQQQQQFGQQWMKGTPCGGTPFLSASTNGSGKGVSSNPQFSIGELEQVSSPGFFMPVQVSSYHTPSWGGVSLGGESDMGTPQLSTGYNNPVSRFQKPAVDQGQGHTPSSSRSHAASRGGTPPQLTAFRPPNLNPPPPAPQLQQVPPHGGGSGPTAAVPVDDARREGTIHSSTSVATTFWQKGQERKCLASYKNINMSNTNALLNTCIEQISSPSHHMLSSLSQNNNPHCRNHLYIYMFTSMGEVFWTTTAELDDVPAPQKARKTYLAHNKPMGRRGRGGNKGITYKLVHLPRADEDDPNAPVEVELVPEGELRGHTYQPGRENVRRQLPAGGGNQNDLAEWADEWYEGEDEEGNWEEFDEEEEGEGEASAPPPAAVEDDEDPLFEDAVEGGVTDDFLRQLVLGTGGAAPREEWVEEGDEEGEWEAEGGEEEEEEDIPMDGEVWRLLSEEERAGVLAARRRGTQRRRTAVPAHVDPITGHAFPTHNTTTRAIDRQFTEMMKEFNVDADINDAYTDNPRTQGPLSVHQYIPALEEFVAERAGMDMETAELAKNKGRLQQLRLMAHREGAFDVDLRDGGVYFPTTQNEKQARFAESFMLETERIRAQAAARVRRARLAQDAEATQLEEAPAPEEETLVVQRAPARSKADRVDCETVVSTYSTYYNQPNVIRPPASSSGPGKPQHCHPKAGRKGQPQHKSGNSDSDGDAISPSVGSRAALGPLIIERPKDETKEEKKQRRQAVKAAQRERRLEKSQLKKAYKMVEAEESRRAATAATARKTVHFA